MMKSTHTPTNQATTHSYQRGWEQALRQFDTQQNTQGTRSVSSKGRS